MTDEPWDWDNDDDDSLRRFSFPDYVNKIVRDSFGAYGMATTQCARI